MVTLFFYSYRLGLAVAAQDVDQLMLNHILNGGTGGLQVLARIEVRGILSHVLADRSGHCQTQVGVDVDLAVGQSDSLAQLQIGRASCRERV